MLNLKAGPPLGLLIAGACSLAANRPASGQLPIDSARGRVEISKSGRPVLPMRPLDALGIDAERRESVTLRGTAARIGDRLVTRPLWPVWS